MGSKTNTQTTTSGPPANVSAAYNDLLARAQQVASTPYQQYSGNMLAPFSGSQQSAFNTIDQAQGIARPYLDQAQQYATQGAAAITPDQINQYLNPYQQSVVNATQANFDESNNRQLAQVKGNAIAKGSLGGDRLGVAQGEAIRQQQLAQAPVIAGLNSQGYSQALSAAQQDAMRKGQAAYTFGNLGQEALGTTLAGAQAQLGSGAQQQQQAQAGLNIPYQQWLQQQAFPYQQTGWLAGIETGVGSQMGGTSTTSSPGPNQAAQWGGLGLAGLGVAGQLGAFGGAAGGASALSSLAPLMMMSDKRAKTDIEKVGETNDGQPIYRFRYKGDPHGTVHMGLMAQEVEKSHPEAVHEAGGLKMVDYDAATKDSYAFGGGVRGYAEGGDIGAIPWSGAAGWVPGAAIVRGSGPPKGGAAPAQQDSGVGKMVQNAMGLASQMRQKPGIGAPLDLAPTGVEMGGGSFSPGMDVTGGMGAIYAHGGMVLPRENGIYVPRGYADGGTPQDYVNDAWQTADAAIADGTMDPQGDNQGHPVRGYSGPPMPLPRARPMEADQPVEVAALEQPGIAAPAYAPVAPPQSFPGTGDGSGGAGIGAPMAGSPAQPSLGDRFQSIAPALISAGFGMMASRSPFLGNAIGEGGLAGVQAYQAQETVKREEAAKQRQFGQGDRRIDLDAKRLDQAAKQAADHLRMQTEQLAETKRGRTEPTGYRMVDGKLEAIPGGPADPSVVRSQAEAKRLPGMGDDALSEMVRSYRAGNTGVLTGVGRGTQGADNLNRFWNIMAAQLKEEGGTGKDLAAAKANFTAQSAAARSAAVREANVASAVEEAKQTFPLALQRSTEVPRGNWVPWTKAVQMVQQGTSSVPLARFVTANQAVITAYSQAMSRTGVNTVHAQQHAENLLSTATSPEAYSAVIGQMQQEMDAALVAPEIVKNRILSGISGREREGGHSGTAAPKVGERKQFKQGWGTWDGKTWVPEKP